MNRVKTAKVLVPRLCAGHCNKPKSATGDSKLVRETQRCSRSTHTAWITSLQYSTASALPPSPFRTPYLLKVGFSEVSVMKSYYCSVAQSCPILCDHMDCNMPGTKKVPCKNHCVTANKDVNVQSDAKIWKIMQYSTSTHTHQKVTVVMKEWKEYFFSFKYMCFFFQMATKLLGCKFIIYFNLLNKQNCKAFLLAYKYYKTRFVNLWVRGFFLSGTTKSKIFT